MIHLTVYQFQRTSKILTNQKKKEKKRKEKNNNNNKIQKQKLLCVLCPLEGQCKEIHQSRVNSTRKPHATATVVKGDYTTRFGTSILYYNFLMNSLKHESIYYQKGNFTRKTIVILYFFYQKSTFLRKSQKSRFLPFFFQNRLQKNWNSKNCFGIV